MPKSATSFKFAAINDTSNANGQKQLDPHTLAAAATVTSKATAATIEIAKTKPITAN